MFKLTSKRKSGMLNKALFKSMVPFVAVMITASSFAIGPAYAQSSDVRALLDRMNRLEADLNSVQRKVFQGQPTSTPSTSGSPAPSYTGGDEGMALLSGRIDALEQEQRRVTGSTEEVNFRLDQLKSRLDKLILDMDYRLSEIEQRLGGGSAPIAGQQNPNALAPNGQAGAATGLANQAPNQVTNQSANNTNSAKVAEGGELPAGTKLLGTLRTNNNGTASAPSASAPAAQAPAVMANLAPEEQYNLAMSLIRKDDYAGAEQAFSQFLEQNREHNLAGNAQYWLGETFYVRGDFNNAASSFLNGYQNYPDSSKAADNLLKLGMTLGRMEQTEEACATFQQLDKQFDILPSRLKQISAREKQKFSCR